MPKDPDRSYLADAIHFMDLIDLADEELPAARATVERAKAAATTARGELDRHQEWLGRHQKLYTEAVRGCERRLKRQAFLGACKQAAWLPIELLTTACTGVFHVPRRRLLRAQLKHRLQQLDHATELPSARQLQDRIQAMGAGRDERR